MPSSLPVVVRQMSYHKGPVVRVCECHSCKLPKVCVRARESAHVQYRSNPRPPPSLGVRVQVIMIMYVCTSACGHVCTHTHTHTHTCNHTHAHMQRHTCNGKVRFALGFCLFCAGRTSSQGVSGHGEHLQIAKVAEVQDLLEGCH